MRTEIHKKVILTISILIIPLIFIQGCEATIPESTMTPAIPESTTTPTITEEAEIKDTPTQEPLATEERENQLTGQVSIWHSFEENEMESFNDLILMFQEMYPEVEFDVLYVPQYDLQGKFEAEAQMGVGACILIGSSTWGPPLYDSILIADVSEFASDEFLATITPAALGSVQYSGALVGLPLNLSGIIPFRNTSIMPVAPTTFDELVELAQEATSGDIVGAYLDYGLYYSAGHLHGIGGQLMDAEGNPTFNDEKGVEWIELLKRFEEAGPIENNNDDDINRFAEGKTGFIIDGLWNASNLAEAIGAENLAIDPWPFPLSGYVQTENLYLNENTTGNNLDACWNFMKFMLSPEAQLILADPEKAGFIPATIGVEVTDSLQMQVMETFQDGTPLPVIPEMSLYWDPVNNALLSVIEQDVDSTDALQSANDEILDQLAETNGE